MRRAGSRPARGRALRARVAVLALAATLAAPAWAKEPPYPEPTGYVVDEAGLLSPETRAHLTEIARELDEKTKVQIAVAVVPSIAPLEVEEYAVRLFEKWGVGGKEKDEGVLFVLARDERRVRIEVGYGLEGLLPDGRVGGILRRSVVPHLRHDDWDAGVTGGIEAIASLVAADRGVTLASLAGTTRPPPDEEEEVSDKAKAAMVQLFAFIMAMMLISMLLNRRRFRARRGIWWLGPGGFGGWSGGGGGWSGGGHSGGGGGFGGFGGGSSGGGGASSGF